MMCVYVRECSWMCVCVLGVCVCGMCSASQTRYHTSNLLPFCSAYHQLSLSFFHSFLPFSETSPATRTSCSFLGQWLLLLVFTPIRHIVRDMMCVHGYGRKGGSRAQQQQQQQHTQD
uniref:Putative secreted protein n=1 Tax=Anopheles triannulatus TaxID=58253 RepID=A0A2M4B0R1_9DIPT